MIGWIHYFPAPMAFHRLLLPSFPPFGDHFQTWFHTSHHLHSCQDNTTCNLKPTCLTRQPISFLFGQLARARSQATVPPVPSSLQAPGWCGLLCQKCCTSLHWLPPTEKVPKPNVLNRRSWRNPRKQMPETSMQAGKISMALLLPSGRKQAAFKLWDGCAARNLYIPSFLWEGSVVCRNLVLFSLNSTCRAEHSPREQGNFQALRLEEFQKWVWKNSIMIPFHTLYFAQPQCNGGGGEASVLELPVDFLECFSLLESQKR